ncbi:MAG: outer membrane lipoprotein-sorting protein [Verrucomicrobia subdivision 3 bacterium]|nr:outer membrane lipoprotein-sorting protein [Limisphaerales bacterium]
MKATLSFALAALVLCASSATSEPTLPAGADPRQVAQELVRDLRASRPASNSELTGALKIRAEDGPTRSVPIECAIRVGPESWQAGYQSYGTNGVPERALIVHWPDKPNEYLYGRGTNGSAPQPITRAEAIQPIGGSDFWLIDLGLDFLHWPSQRVIKTEMRSSRWCNVLESIQPNPPPGSYGRVVSWLDKETGGPILAEAYDTNNKLLKEFSIKSVKKLDGEWQLQEMQISNRKTGSRTRLEFDLKSGQKESLPAGK